MKGGPHAVRPAEAADSLRTSDTREKKSSYTPQSLLVNIPVHARGPASMYVHFCDLRWRLCMRPMDTPTRRVPRATTGFELATGVDFRNRRGSVNSKAKATAVYVCISS